MHTQSANQERVTEAILTEIQGILGLAQFRWIRGIVRSIFGLPAGRVARLLVQLDQDTARFGLRTAAEHMLDTFVEDYRVDNESAIPRHGPLLVVSNHPGAYDAFVLLASLFREDLKIISSEITIFRHMPSVAPYFIEVTNDPYRRMAAFRAALRHLQENKALLIFPRGEVEVDPAHSLDTLQSVDNWSLSLDLFIRKVPQVSAVVAAVSGVYSPHWVNNPVIQLWKRPEQRQKVAEMIQVAEQMVLSKKSLLIPRVSFSQPLHFSEPGEGGVSPGWQMDALRQTARDQLAAVIR